MESLVLLAFYVLVPGAILAALRGVISSISSASTHASTTNTQASKPDEITYPGRFPGPKQYPIVGRVHDLPRFSMWKKFKEWADEFGPIYQTSMLGQKFVIISEEKIARDLLVKKGNKYAGRPQIRALINHKAGPVYSALMDRHGMLESKLFPMEIHSFFFTL